VAFNCKEHIAYGIKPREKKNCCKKKECQIFLKFELWMHPTTILYIDSSHKPLLYRKQGVCHFVHFKNQIQIQASKQENTQLCFVIFAKCCCCWSLQKNKYKSKQARKHTIMLCDIC
jgi:hypothetical protein